jgi:hypothetical protein
MQKYDFIGKNKIIRKYMLTLKRILSVYFV